MTSGYLSPPAQKLKPRVLIGGLSDGRRNALVVEGLTVLVLQHHLPAVLDRSEDGGKLTSIWLTSCISFYAASLNSRC
jgi:hypothetical protein